MPDRLLFTVATVVVLFATVVGVLLDVPLYLTDQGINVNTALIISGIAAVGTVGTLTWAVINGLDLRRRADDDRREAGRVRDAETIEKQLDQARRVSAWSVPIADVPAGLFPIAMQTPDAQQVNLTNSSAEAVYNVVAYLVWMQGAAPHTAEEIEKWGGAHRMRAIVQVLPPGNYKMVLPGPSDHPMQGQGRLGLEVAFTDGAGRHWVRRARTGKLESLAADPISHFGISRPLPPYNQIDPW